MVIFNSSSVLFVSFSNWISSMYGNSARENAGHWNKTKYQLKAPRVVSTQTWYIMTTLNFITLHFSSCFDLVASRPDCVCIFGISISIAVFPNINITYENFAFSYFCLSFFTVGANICLFCAIASKCVSHSAFTFNKVLAFYSVLTNIYQNSFRHCSSLFTAVYFS